MDKVGILIVSKCLSASAIIDTFARSESYSPEFFVVERQLNPRNFKRAKVHKVIPDLNIREIAKFAASHRNEISFGLTDTEDFVTAGGRDVVEKESGVPMLCVTKEFAVEANKAKQRSLFERILPQANPRYKIFSQSDHSSVTSAVQEFRRFSRELSNGYAIKPDAPARGAGVGVWGKDFLTEEEAVAFFQNVLSKGRVVVEERIEGEESSFHAFSDGRHFIPAPLTRDYKRALDGDMGKLTGGMGSYRGTRDVLPFLRDSEWDHVLRLEQTAFEKWKGGGSNPALRGIVLYDALMHTTSGFKILERNSRGGNTEQMCFLTTMLDDYVDVCYRMMEGNLKGIRFSNKACVVTCAVPIAYGISPPQLSQEAAVGLDRAYSLEQSSERSIRVFPMDLRINRLSGATLMGSSRSVAVAGIADSTEEARKLSVEGVAALEGPFRYRRDIGSAADITRSKEHLLRIRRAAREEPVGTRS